MPAASLALSALAFVLAAITVLFAPARPLQLPLLGVLVYVAALGLARYQGWLGSGAHEYAALGAGGALCLTGYLAGQNGSLPERLWQITLWCGGGLAIAAFLDFALDPELNFGRSRPYHETRLAAPFLSANTAATFYGIIAVMSLAEIIRVLSAKAAYPLQTIERAVVGGLFPITFFLFALSNVILTASRAGAAATVAALIALILWETMSRWARGRLRVSLTKAGSVLTMGVVVTVGLYLISGDLLQQRLSMTAEDESRTLLLASYAEAATLEPVLGHGLGGFVWVNDLVSTAETGDLLQVQGAAHNVYLQWIIQAGAVGTAMLALVLLPLLATIAHGLSVRRRRTTYLRATLCITLLIALHGMVDYAVEIPMVMWWFAWILGLAAGLATKARGA